MIVLGLLALPAGASAVGARAVRAKPPARPYLDSRVGASRAIQRAGSVGTRGERAARSRLRTRLGAQAVVEVDPLTGTARSVQRLDGTLTGPAAGDRAAVAMSWLRANRTALGVTGADLDAMTLADRKVDPGTGFTYLRYRQYYRGIPTFDGGMRVNLDRGGRILNVTGAPVSGLSVPSVTPELSAAGAMRALQANVDVRRAVDVTSGPSGVRDVTRFARGDFARLVLFDGPNGVRLAWHLTYRATSLAYYDAVVDATSGAILFRQNLTKFDAVQSVYPNYPGAEKEAGAKGAANGKVTVNFETRGWLTGAETNLDGTNVHAYSDVNDNDDAEPTEEITRADASSDYPNAFNDFAAPLGETNACEWSGSYPVPPTADWPPPIARTADCSWDPTVANSWQSNRAQNGVQAFYLANLFHDHLAAAPINFTAAEGNFTGADKLELNTDDGADGGGTGLPNPNHINNANMSTPPKGDPVDKPLMQMYLFENDPTELFQYRNINGGDDAATVWHEYTHGLSNRLITHADGEGAVSSPHAGAMGEAWSDWYALDYLHQRGLENTDVAAPGQVDIGVYSDAVFASTRFEPADCRVTVDDNDLHCPGGNDTGPGGFTFGDFGHVLGIPEVHSDGEIWLQTLWDLRRALGSTKAEQLITQGMRLSGPEPSFLDERNAILAAEAGVGNADRMKIWSVFAHRGMGYRASVTDSSDTTPTEDFSLPPNVPPSGALHAGAARVNPGQPVLFRATFSDPDSTIARYDWDFDGNGTSDHTTTTPTATFTYGHGGGYAPRVTVTDTRGGSGAAATLLYVTRIFKPDRLRGGKGQSRFRVRCDRACDVSAKLKVSGKVRQQLGLASRTVGSLKRSLAPNAGKGLTIKLSRKAKRALASLGLKKVRPNLTATARYPADGRQATARRTVTITR